VNILQGETRGGLWSSEGQLGRESGPDDGDGDDDEGNPNKKKGASEI